MEWKYIAQVDYRFRNVILDFTMYCLKLINCYAPTQPIPLYSWLCSSNVKRPLPGSPFSIFLHVDRKSLGTETRGGAIPVISVRLSSSSQ